MAAQATDELTEYWLPEGTAVSFKPVVYNGMEGTWVPLVHPSLGRILAFVPWEQRIVRMPFEYLGRPWNIKREPPFFSTIGGTQGGYRWDKDAGAFMPIKAKKPPRAGHSFRGKCGTAAVLGFAACAVGPMGAAIGIPVIVIAVLLMIASWMGAVGTDLVT